MLLKYRRGYILFSGLLAIFLLNGCVSTTTTAKLQPQVPVGITAYQRAMNAIEENHFQQAVGYFQQALHNEQLADVDLYYYAHALNQTGAYAAAVKIYTQYIGTFGRRAEHLLAALAERTAAEKELRLQREARARAELAEQRFQQIAPTLEQNWLLVQQQLSDRPATFNEPFTGMEMILVRGGCFPMGDLFGDGRKDEQPVHEVCVDDFYLAKYEVTQAQWQKLMGYNSSRSNQGADFPVETVSWSEAVEFTDNLGGAARRFRLPTEAEWEFAARSRGRKEKFSGSNSGDRVAWHEKNSALNSHPVGRKKPNSLGFYDMSGNVYEWCLDRYAEDTYQHSPKLNPTGAKSGTDRSRRGGSWDSAKSFSRTSSRSSGNEKNYRLDDTGFRLLLPLSN